MKKISTFPKKIFLLFLLVCSGNLMFSNCYAASGLFDAFAIVKRNGGANEFIGYGSFDGFNLGTFNNTQTLVLNGGQNKTFKNGGSNVTGGQIAYRIYRSGTGAPSFSFIQLNFLSNDGGGGDQTWQTDNANINVLSGLTGGNYILEAFWQAYTSDGDKFYSNSGNNYKATFTVSYVTSAVGNWNDNTKWVGNLVPPSGADVSIAHNFILNTDVSISSININSGVTFTATDATPRTLTITKSTSGTSTTLNNAGTWTNGTGVSTVIFTGAPSSGNAVHAIAGTIPFNKITVNKTSGSSDVGASFGTGSSVSGTLEIGTGGYVSSAPPASFYGANAILRFNQGAGVTYNVGATDDSWSISQVPNNISISSGTVSLNADRTAPGDLLIDGGALVITNSSTLTIQKNWTRSSGSFTPGTGTVNLSGTSNGTISVATPAQMYNLTINKTGGVGVIMGASSDVNVANVLTLTAGTLFIASNTLTLNGTVSGPGFLKGSITSNLTIGGTGSLGTLNFDQSTDGSTDTSANASNSLQNFTLNRTSSGAATLGNKLIIINTYTPTAGILTSGGNLVLRSTFANTARIAQGTSGYITGNVTVERFITSINNRAYRLLGPSVNTTVGSKQYIKGNWQEGVNNTDLVTNNNPFPGYGTHITGSTSGANGFDATQTGGAGLFTYSYGSPDTYVPIGNTDNTVLEAKTGYLLFIRGDRTLTHIQAAPTSSNTTLRTTGTLLTGDVTYTLQPSPKFTLVTNPYASSISWASIYNDPANGYNGSTNPNLVSSYNYLDPNVGTRGGYVTVTTAGAPTPSSGGTASIQTGQAFFVKSNLGGTPSLTIKESHKSITNNNNVFRTGSQEQLSIGLYFNMPNGGGRRIADGVNVLFNNDYSAGFDGNDAEEIANFDENLAILRQGKMLSIEGRPLIDENDTIFLAQARLKVQNYEFEFNPSSFNAPGLQAYLQDKFLNTETSISLTEQTVVPFTVSSNAASSASDRFRVVFRGGSVLPINFTNVKAFEKGNNIQVEWNLGNEQNMQHYEVEKSIDGRIFTKAGMQTARAVMSADNYQWLDQQASIGNNYYRIKAIEKGGTFKYSQVVNVRMGKGNSTISIYPNPIIGNVISLQFSNIEKGKYQLTLSNNLGQLVYSRMIVHNGGSASQSINVPGKLAAGSYQMQVKGGGKNITQQLIKN